MDAGEFSARALTGSIGRTSNAATPNALELSVDRIATQSAGDTYLAESDGLIVDRVNAVGISATDVQRVNFRSSPRTEIQTSLSVEALDDITSFDNIQMLTPAGGLVVNDGLDNDGVGIQSTSTGHILILSQAPHQAGANAITTSSGIATNGGRIHVQATVALRLETMSRRHVMERS